MKTLILLSAITFLLQSNCLFAQEKSGFEALLSTKLQIENIVKKITVLPDSSSAYRKYYNELNNSYIKAASEYNAYKGSMINCIYSSSTSKKSRNCLSENSLNLKDDLDDLLAVTDKAYNEHFNLATVTKDKNAQAKPAGSLSLIPNIIENLVDGGMKIWNVVKDLKGQYKKEYIDQINSEAYLITSFEMLVPPPR